MESSMDTFVLNEDNHKKWEELHAQSSKTETRLVPNDAVQKIFSLRNQIVTQNDECRVLEVGCGFGRNLYYLIENHYADTYCGVDLTKEAADSAKQLLTKSFPQFNCRIAQTDVGKGLDFPDNHFDSIFDIMSAITFIVDEKDRQNYFSEVKRVLKAGGMYYFYCPRKDGIFRDAIPDNSLLEKGYIRRKLDSMLERVYTESELIELLAPMRLVKLEIGSKHTRAFGDELFIRNNGFWFGAFKKI